MINWIFHLSPYEALSYAIMASPFILIPVVELIFSVYDRAIRYNVEIAEYSGSIEGFTFDTFCGGSKMAVEFHIPRANCLGRITVDPHNLDQIDKAKTVLEQWSGKILESAIHDELRMKQIKGENL